MLLLTERLFARWCSYRANYELYCDDDDGDDDDDDDESNIDKGLCVRRLTKWQATLAEN